MRLEPTMKQAVVRRTVRKFAEERISPVVAEMERSGEFSREVIGELSDLHYFGLEIPQKYGGAALDSISYAIVIEELSRICAAIGLCISVHNSVSALPV